MANFVMLKLVILSPADMAHLDWLERAAPAPLCSDDAVSGNFASAAFNVNILQKSAPKPFIDHLARDKANAINTFVQDDLKPNTANMSGNSGSGQGGGMVAYTHYGEQVRWRMTETRACAD